MRVLCVCVFVRDVWNFTKNSFLSWILFLGFLEWTMVVESLPPSMRVHHLSKVFVTLLGMCETDGFFVYMHHNAILESQTALSILWIKDDYKIRYVDDLLLIVDKDNYSLEHIPYSLHILGTSCTLPYLFTKSKLRFFLWVSVHNMMGLFTVLLRILYSSSSHIV